MSVRTVEGLRALGRSAFRILGLAASATYAEILDAPARIRRAARLRNSTALPSDISWLPAAPRADADLNAAIGRLQEPQARVQERLLWFHEIDPKTASVALDEWDSVADTLQRTSVLGQHDAALLRLASAWLLDPEVRDFPRWAHVVSAWNKLAGTAAYWEALTQTEARGGFERTASAEDIASLRLTAVEVALDGLPSAACTALGAGHLDHVERIIQLLSAPDLDVDARRALVGRILRALEDDLEQRCEQFRRWLNEAVVHDNESADANRKACDKAARDLELELEPRLTLFTRFAVSHEDGARRARETMAGCIGALANAYTWANAFTVAESHAENAVALANGMPAAPRLQRALEDIRKSAETQRQHERVWKGLEPIDSAPTLYTINGIGSRLYGATDHEPFRGSYIATYYFTVLYIPLFPVRRYRVIPTDGGYQFLGRAPLRQGDQVHRWIAGLLVGALILVGLLTSDSKPRSYSSPSSYTRTTPSVPSSAWPVSPPTPLQPNRSDSRAALRARIEAERATLDHLKAEIEALDTKVLLLNDRLQSLKDKIEEFESQDRFGMALDRAAYEQALDEYNSLVSVYNERLKERKRLIIDYNAGVDRHNAMLTDHRAQGGR